MVNAPDKRTTSRVRAAFVRALMVSLVLASFPGMAATNLYVSGTGGYNTYRIPALYETTNGTLLAFCEGRVNSSSDTGNIDIVIRRSFDGGVTWTAQQVVWGDGANTCGNPTVVQDRNTGRIWLFLTWNNGSDSQSEIQNGTSLDVRKIYSCYSDDDGASWSVPVNRFAELQPSSTRWDATGPGCGIQMRAGPYPGRLIIPANGRNIHSDDHGATWSQSAWLPGGSSESQEVEISGGVLLRNDRASGGNTSYKARVFCRSTNQGASWNAVEVRLDLVCPVCQASTITVSHPAGLNGRMLVFSNPSSTSRDHMTIQCSLDDGETWPFRQLVYSGSSAYSCLTTVGNNHVGLLYERDSYGKITFDKFAISALAPNTPTNQPPQIWDGGAGLGKETWQEANNWVSNAIPIFDSGLDVIFNTAGAGNLTNAIGDHREIRSLNFNADAQRDIAIILAEKVNSPATNCVLTFDGFLGSASNKVASGATGNFTIGAGGGGGLGSIMLASDLVVTHDGSGELKFDRPISGLGGITKNGNGTLFLRQSNLYRGSTVINAGTVVTGGNSGGFGDVATAGPMFLNGGTICNSTGASRPIYNNVTVGGNFAVGGVADYGAGLLAFSGRMDLGGAARILTINTPVTLAGVVVNGGLSKNGLGALTLTGANTYTGQSTIFSGTLQIGDGGGSGSLEAASTIAIGPDGILQYNRTNNLSPFANTIAGIGTIVKTNIGELGLAGTNSFSGTIQVTQGKLGLSGAGCVNGVPDVMVGSAGILSIGTGFLGAVATIGNLTGTGRIDPVYGQGTAVRTLMVNQSSDGVFSGIMADGTSGRVLGFTKHGAARLTLGGTNTYSGPTTVIEGALIVNGVIGNSAVTVLGGTLGGTGVLRGPVVVQGAGILSPGASVGTMAISNTLALAGTTFVEIHADNGQSDRIQGLTGIAYGGALIVSNVSPAQLSIGQSFQLFLATGSRTGNFDNITPALTGGKKWSFDPTRGILSVVATTASYRTNVSAGVSNGIVALAWPESHLGWIAQSNATTLASTGSWFDIAGSEGVRNLTIAPAAAGSNVFYRLRSPD